MEGELYIPTNFYIARQRLVKTVEKLNNQGLLRAYSEVFETWLAENIIEKISEKDVSHIGHYLSHRPVIKMNSTTKIRPVFDTSAKKKGHPSLNDCLEKGPYLMELVPSALNRFRERKVGVISDIKGAFLQVEVNESDRDHLCFLWEVDGKIFVFCHCRVMFGLSSSPFLLSAVIALLLDRSLQKVQSGDEF